MIHHATLLRHEEDGQLHWLSWSMDFEDAWKPEVEALCRAFGKRPPGLACPEALFVQPFGKQFVAIVQVADQPGGLGFRFLRVPRLVYLTLDGDPFLIAAQFPPAWSERDAVATLVWPEEAPGRRMIAEVQQILQSEEGPTLLGATQALLDGGRLVFERPAPAADVVRKLWLLLPTSSRCELPLATFAFSNELAFPIVVTPRYNEEDFAGYLTEEQMGDYPQGRYELHLQIAAEEGDQLELDRLLARRSRAQTWRLGLVILVLITLLLLLLHGLPPGPR